MAVADRHLAAIMFTDIVGFTTLMQQDEENAVVAMRHYQNTMQTLVSHHQGAIENDYGDGNLCSFSSAVEAVKCAQALQEAFRAAPVLPVRIGIHLGELMHDEGKVLGDGVNIASRIQSLATANSILVSADVIRVIRNHPEFKWVSLGVVDLKNVQQPIEVFAMTGHALDVPDRLQLSGKLAIPKADPALASAGKSGVFIMALIVLGILLLIAYQFLVRKEDHVISPVKSIAVLPLINLGMEEEKLYFSDGVTEDILNQLVKIADLQVKSRTSTLQYRNNNKPMKEIARELDVNYILEGSVRKADNQVRVVVQLVDARNDIQLWSETYDRELKDILAIQLDIARQITMALKASLADKESSSLGREQTITEEAYDNFLRARDAFHRIVENPVYLDKSLSYINAALKEGPDYAEAYALKGRILYYQRDIGAGEVIWRDSALAYANKSILLDDHLPDGYFTRALVAFYLGNTADYKADLIRAFSLAPNDPEILERYGRLLLDEGNELGAELLFRGVGLKYSPQDPLFYFTWDDVVYYLYDDGYDLRDKLIRQCQQKFPDYYPLINMKYDLYLNSGRLEECLQLVNEAKERYPDRRGVADSYAWVNFYLKNYGEAISQWARYKEFESGFSDTSQRVTFRHRLGMVYWMTGEKRKADRLFREQLSIQKRMIARQQSRGVSNSSLAGVYYDLAVCEAYFGNYPAMMDALEKSFFTYHFFWYWGLRNELLFQQYAGKPEFENFLSRIKVTEEFKKKAIRNALDYTDSGKSLKRQLGV